MQSTTAISFELDNIEQAVSELKDQIDRSIRLEKKTVGILFCDCEMDHALLMRRLTEELKFPLIGCTTVGTIGQAAGFHEFCISLTVLSADDCKFHICASEPFDPDTARAVVADTYRTAAAALGETPKLILALPAYRLDTMLDLYSDVLTEASGGVPVFGGMPCSNTPGGNNAVLVGDRVHTNCIGLLLIGGNLRPLFATQNRLETLAEQKRTVTEAKDNVIYRVGDTTFVDYMKGIGFQVEGSGGMDDELTFLSNPLLVEGVKEDDGVPLVRTLHALNLKTGAGITIGRVPEGATLSVGVLRKEDIRISAEGAMRELLEKIREHETDGYRYSTILCVSCIVRFLAMAPNSEMEGGILTELSGGKYTLGGYYGYGELCPIGVGDAGAKNRAHNESITLCAF